MITKDLTTHKPFSFTALNKQEARLSQRGRAMLRVIKYFAKSLKTTQRQ